VLRCSGAEFYSMATWRPSRGPHPQNTLKESVSRM